MLGEFTEARREDALERGAVAALARLLKQRVEIAAFPELVLEGIGLRRRALEREHLEENLPPRPHREEQQQHHDSLDDHAGVNDHGKERKVGMQVQLGFSGKALRPRRTPRKSVSS